MINQTELTISNFGYYVFHPFSEELSPTDQKIALIGTILLGLTFGIGHLICRLFFYDKVVEEINSKRSVSINADSSIKRVDQDKKQSLVPPIDSNPKKVSSDLETPKISSIPDAVLPQQENAINRKLLELSEEINLNASIIITPETINQEPLDLVPQTNLVMNLNSEEDSSSQADDNRKGLSKLPNEPRNDNEAIYKPKSEQILSETDSASPYNNSLKNNGRKLETCMIDHYIKLAESGDRDAMDRLKIHDKEYPACFQIEEIKLLHQQAIRQRIEENKKCWAKNDLGSFAFAIARDSEYVGEGREVVMYWYAEAAKRGNYYCLCTFQELYQMNPLPSFDINEIKQAYQTSKMREINQSKEEMSKGSCRFKAGLIASLYDQTNDKQAATFWHVEAAKRGDTHSYYTLKNLQSNNPSFDMSKIEEAYLSA
jgi:hypothetical protein